MNDIDGEVRRVCELVAVYSPAYGKLTANYDSMADNDPMTAFGLMKTASNLQASYDTLTGKVTKLVLLQEKYARFIQSKKSCELATKPTEGERQASRSPEVLEEWSTYAMVVSMQKQLEGICRHLNRIYYDSKSVYEIGSRQLNKGFKYE